MVSRYGAALRRGARALQREAVSRMTVDCRVERPQPARAVTDELGNVSIPRAVVWAGKCWLRRVEMLGGAQITRPAGYLETSANVRAHIPVDAPSPLPGDRFIVVHDPDQPDLDGSDFRVRTTAVNSRSTAKRVELSAPQQVHGDDDGDGAVPEPLPEFPAPELGEGGGEVFARNR